MKLAKTKALLGLSIFVASLLIGFLPTPPIPSVTPKANAAGKSFIMPDGHTAANPTSSDIGTNIQFINATTIMYIHGGHHYYYQTSATNCSESSPDDSTSPSNIYFCGHTGDEYQDDSTGSFGSGPAPDGDTFAATQWDNNAHGIAGYAYWFWCTRTDDTTIDTTNNNGCSSSNGAPLLTTKLGNNSASHEQCQSAFIFTIKLNSDDNGSTAIKGAYLSTVTPDTDPSGACIIRDKTGNNQLNSKDEDGIGAAPQNPNDDEYVSLNQNSANYSSDCIGTNAEDASTQESRQCEIGDNYVVDHNLLAGGNAAKALLGIGTIFAWDPNNIGKKLVSNFSGDVDVSSDPITLLDSSQNTYTILLNQFKTSKSSTVRGYNKSPGNYLFFTSQACYQNSKYQAAFVVAKNDLSKGQVVSANLTSGGPTQHLGQLNSPTDYNNMVPDWNQSGDADPDESKAKILNCLYGVTHNRANVNPALLWGGSNTDQIGISNFLFSDPAIRKSAPLPTSQQGTISTPSASCSFSITNPLTWFLCPITNLVISLASSFDNLIDSSLCIPVNTASDSNSTPVDDCTGNPVDKNSGTSVEQFKPAWQIMRGIALGLIVIIGLLAIVSQASGMQIFDAYTVKKIMPRLAFAAIAVSLSWPLLNWFIGLTNDLGFGVRAFIYAPFPNLHGTFGAGGGFMENFFANAGIALLGFAGLLSFGATAALFLSIALLALVVRQIAVIGLVVVAPIALMLYAAPFGQRFAQLWWKEFTQLTFAFPLIAGAIAIGHVFGVLTLNSNSFGASIIGFTAYIAGDIAAIGILAKRGAILGLAVGALQRAAKPAHGLIGGFRNRQIQNRGKNAGSRFASGNLLKGWAGDSRVGSRVNRSAAYIAATRKAGLNPLNMRSNVSSHLEQHHYADAKNALQNNHDVQNVVWNDDYNDAILKYDTDRGVRDFLASRRDKDGKAIYQGQGLEDAVSNIRRARQSTSTATLKIAAAIMNPAAGTSYAVQHDADGNVIAGGAGAMMRDALTAAHGNEALAARIYKDQRDSAQQARRIDLYGGSFSEGLTVLNAMNRVGGPTDNQATERMQDSALNGNAGVSLGYARKQSAEALAPAQRKRLERFMQQAMATGSEQDINRWVKEMGAVAGTLDGLNSSSPENAEFFSEGIMGQEIDIRTMPPAMIEAILGKGYTVAPADGKMKYAEVVERLRANPVAAEVRREYGNAFAQQQAQEAQRIAGGGLPGAPGGPAGPTPTNPTPKAP